MAYVDVSRLKRAIYYGRGDHSVAMEYDKNGNISTLNRSGYISGEDMFGPIDQLTYSYRENQLMAVNDNPDLAFQTEGFVDNATFENEEYGYDKNGNMVIILLIFLFDNENIKAFFPIDKGNTLMSIKYDSNHR